ncbi:MAG TPA: phenylalanine--tRNA ligase beta subunit-related protein [Xanthobacteraceae bacterium]|nr:phenylalanine--tRNA ligase beta subunit-related protein [Xanthobacteraceae bacterium]
MQICATIADIADAFPEFRVAVVVAENLTILPHRPETLDALIRAREVAARARWAGIELARIPGIAAWRAAYKGFGVKQTRYRSSVERLLKNVLAGRDLPRVNSFVDLYNAVSLQHVLPLGADDLDKVSPPLAFRYARENDSFVDMASNERDAVGENGDVAEAPKAGEVVYADTANVLCRRWNWRQDARSLITPQTTRAVVTIQANGWGEPEAAAEELADLIARYCDGHCRMAMLDGAHRRSVV